MKLVTTLSLVSIFGSFTAFAYPEVNNTATYDLTQSGMPATTLVISIADISIDASSQSPMATVNYTEGTNTAPSQTIHSTVQNLKDVSKMLDHCTTAGMTGATAAVLEPAANFEFGSLPSCHLSAKDAASGAVIDAWFGAVPFGVLKEVVTVSGITQTIELKATNTSL